MRITLSFLMMLGLVLPLIAQELSESFSEPDRPIEKVAPPDVLTNQTEATFPHMNRVVDSKALFLMNVGIQYTEEEEYEEAERAYLRALKIDPDHERIRFQLGTFYLRMDRYTEAISILEALVAEYPDHSSIRNNLAWAYAIGEGVKNKKMALLHAREALLSAPIDPSVWNTLAEAYYIAGEYEKAERSSKHAIDLMIQTDPEQTQIADFQAQLQKIQRAAQALKRLEGLGNDDD